MKLLAPISSQPAYTIAETLITITIFVVLASVGLEVMTSGIQSSKKIKADTFLVTEAQALMDLIGIDVASNAIDYEAYFAREVLAETGWTTTDYGAYGRAFIHPGDDGGPTHSAMSPYDFTDSYGSLCPDGSSTYPDDCPSDIPLTDSLDFDTGAHPFTDIDDIDSSTMDNPTYNNAFCGDNSADCADMQSYQTNELLLINGAGDQRIVILRECLDSDCEDYRLAKVVLKGKDTDNDGIAETWTCNDDYTCNGSDDGPAETDLTDDDSGAGEDFMPISPSKLDIEDFYILVTPVEDPYRAFAEEDENIQIQPKVTIVMTVTLSDSYAKGILGDTPSITVQRTLSTEVYNEVTSYE